MTAVDKETAEIVGEWETAGKNPQFLTYVDDRPLGAYLFVVNSGAVAYVDGRFRSTSTPSLERWSFGEDLTLQSRELLSLEASADAAVAAPGELLISSDGRIGYLAGATEPVLYKVDLENMDWIRGPDDPIRIGNVSGDALYHAALDDRGIVYVTSFNEDALYLIDTTCDERLAGPIDLGQSSVLLEGPHGIVVHGAGDQWRGYFAMSLSNVLGFVEFFW